MTKVSFYMLLLLFTTEVFAQYQGPIPAPASGYGAEGTHPVSVENIDNDRFASKNISVYFPTGTTSPIPTIFFLHGYGGNDATNYVETLRNLASNGYAVVFVPYRTLGITNAERYSTLYDGFVKAAQNLPNVIDTSRVGFFGHSFGGGAVPRISYRLFSEKNWGANGKFIYCSAPWYSLELGEGALANYPVDCNMLTLLFDQDDVNDHRMGMDVFNNIAIGSASKDCIFVYNDTIDGYNYEANHGLPAQYSSAGVFDAHDYYVTFRLLGALADYTFTGNLTAKDIALGNGSAAQVNMGNQLTPLSVTDSPVPVYEEDIYTFPCSGSQNERRESCQTIVGISGDITEENEVKIFPNPTNGVLNIDSEQLSGDIHVAVYTIAGRMLLTAKYQAGIDLSHFKAGAYLVVINVDGRAYTKKILKAE